jgi:hypothetical protein
MNGYAVVVVVVPPTIGWGAATAPGAHRRAVAAAAAAAVQRAAVFLARLSPNMDLLRSCRWGDARVWGVRHGACGLTPCARASGTTLTLEGGTFRIQEGNPLGELREGKPLLERHGV